MITNGYSTTKTSKTPTIAARAERAMRRAADNVKAKNYAFKLPVIVLRNV